VVGQVLGSYRVLDKLGEGGMGAVYLAEHTTIGRRVAIKVLLPECSRDPEIVRRFFNEARATSNIDHAGLITVFDFGNHGDGSAYIVMELLSGEPLSKRIAREGRMAPDVVVALARQIAGALAAAHAQGIVHRDLKPDNLYLLPDREVAVGVRVKVLDFGIAKLMGGGAGQVEQMRRTRTGVLMGTPLYMSPEQCRGAGELDARADIYSLGCILFEMLCGKPPFTGDGVGDVFVAHMRDEPPAPSSMAAVPPALEGLVLRALEKSPDARQQTMDALDFELAELQAAGLPAGAEGPRGTLVRSAATPRSGRPSAPTTPRPASTQLEGEAHGLSIPPRRSRTPLLLVGALVVLGGAALVALKLTGRKTGSAAAGTAVAASPDAAVAAPGRPGKVRITVRSEPSGADVVRVLDGTLLGQTPLVDHEVETGAPLELALRLPGHEERTLLVPTDRDGTFEKLLPELQPTASPGATPAPSPTPSMSTSPTPSPSPSGPPDKVRYAITSEPSGATVVLDGKRVGKTPYKFSAAPGKHEFSLDCGGYARGKGSLSASERNRHLTLGRLPGTPFGVDCE